MTENTSYTEWPLDENGFPHRQAARVVLLDPSGNIFLIRGHDIDDPEYSWWFTPGGGIEPGESTLAAAVRELREETGFVVDRNRLEGPVLSRFSTFHFISKIRKQDEKFYLLRVDDDEAEAIHRGHGRDWTPLEQELLDAQRWWNLEDLDCIQQQGQLVFPRKLVAYVRAWRDGWDGVCRTITEE
ncbi:NUDIX hydrolase [Arcanobacterium phocae]|uniref:NUDIX hydrolase n=1 Tax=Arcanobacterium phocae TaxID=131112 RepID=UPI001C0F28AF|nr:NUDIX domain-containing protein [Arcanobacterium phocae]